MFGNFGGEECLISVTSDGTINFDMINRRATFAKPITSEQPKASKEFMETTISLSSREDAERERRNQVGLSTSNC